MGRQCGTLVAKRKAGFSVLDRLGSLFQPDNLLPMTNIAIYPGTFDPLTNGHLDILQRACRIFDHVIIGVAPNTTKHPLFDAPERVELITSNIAGLNAEVRLFDGLVVDFARSVGASALIRGLRAVSDFEFEFQMTQMNRDLDPGIETIFLMPGARYFFTSSTLMKQVSAYDPERIAKFVPVNVASALKRKFKHT
jgi:pantetheine-phosphate adenylyltransferase